MEKEQKKPFLVFTFPPIPPIKPELVAALAITGLGYVFFKRYRK